MSTACTHCSALKFSSETEAFCCSSGSVLVPPHPEPPQPLLDLIMNRHRLSRHFFRNALKLNVMFAMTSFGANNVPQSTDGSSIRVSGQLYHEVGSLLPNEGRANFLQVYFVADFQQQARHRQRIFPEVDMGLILDIQRSLHEHNFLVRRFKSSVERCVSEQGFLLLSAEARPAGDHAGRYNPPVEEDIAVILDASEGNRRDIVLRPRGGGREAISSLHRFYDALQYPLLFPRGDSTYHIEIWQRAGDRRITCSQYYRYLFMVRDGFPNYLQRCDRLFEQLAVDTFVKIEENRLAYIREHQVALRSANYQVVRDAVDNNEDVFGLGRRVVLPSSFTGSFRYMHERMQDALTFIREFGNPELFITFTCNSRWPEIKSNTFEHQLRINRQDIIARVFNLKLKKLLDLIKVKKIFGTVRAIMHTVEWQKRGLPHAHLLVWLSNQIEPATLDSVISAELPDPTVDPALFNIIKSTNVHSHNNNSGCMRNGRCKKGFPKPFVSVTDAEGGGYPKYRRRSPADGGLICEGRYGAAINNSDIVPYNPFLSRVFNCHINVENSCSIKAIKYVCKYVNKGPDAVMFAIANQQDWNDEILRYVNGRYVSSGEALWRIFEFKIHEHRPNVVRLPVHLENGHRVYIRNGCRLDNILDRSSKLICFFRLCGVDSLARTLKYMDVPAYFVWKTVDGTEQWHKRTRGSPVPGFPEHRKSDTITRIYTVSVEAQECYYLRLLLLHVRGPTSFSSLKTIEGTVYNTFRDACLNLGLLLNDFAWNQTLIEAATRDSPHRMRRLFALMMKCCDVGNPKQLFERHKDSMAGRVRPFENPAATYQRCLSKISWILLLNFWVLQLRTLQ